MLTTSTLKTKVVSFFSMTIAPSPNMWTRFIIAHFFLVIQNYGASANCVRDTDPSNSIATPSICDGLLNMTSANGSTGSWSLDVTQPTVPNALVTAQDSRFSLFEPNFAKVELHLGDLHGSGVIRLTSSSTGPITGDPVSVIASPRCTPNIQNIPKSLSMSNQNNTARSNDTTSVSAVPAPTGLFNNTNFRIPRLSAPALQSMSGDPKWKLFASSYLPLVAAAVSVLFAASL